MQVNTDRHITTVHMNDYTPKEKQEILAWNAGAFTVICLNKTISLT